MLTRPNPRLQRTPSAPLSRQPLGGWKSLFVVWLSVASLGCASAVPDLRHLQESLALEVTLPGTTFQIGQTFAATIRLRNKSLEAVDACIGEGLSYHLFGKTADRGRLLLVDHPTCHKRFSLKPGEALEWSESIEVGDVGVGPARLSTSVQIVALHGCDPRYGCYATSVSAGFVPIEIAGTSQKAQ